MCILSILSKNTILQNAGPDIHVVHGGAMTVLKGSVMFGINWFEDTTLLEGNEKKHTARV